jgi:hypothetical protein
MCLLVGWFCALLHSTSVCCSKILYLYCNCTAGWHPSRMITFWSGVGLGGGLSRLFVSGIGVRGTHVDHIMLNVDHVDMFFSQPRYLCSQPPTGECCGLKISMRIMRTSLIANACCSCYCCLSGSALSGALLLLLGSSPTSRRLVATAFVLSG